MDEPAAWRELGARFTELRRENDDRLYACWISSGYNSRGDQWYLTGTEDASAHEHFKWAAERAAVLLGQSAGPATLFFWLDLLKGESPRYRGGGISETYLDEDLVKASETGHIGFLCSASAEYCYKLETAAIARRDPSAARIEIISANVEARAEARAHEEFLVEKMKKELRLKDSLANAANILENPPLDEPTVDRVESMAAQLSRLHDESGLTVEELAEKVGIEPRSVFRHFSGKVKPYKRHISAYERVFSKLLKRQVVIRKMS